MTEPLVITRLVPATPEQLWLSWTTEPGLATWWWHTWPDTRYRVNAWVGGEYRIEAAENYRQGWTFVLDALAGTGASG